MIKNYWHSFVQQHLQSILAEGPEEGASYIRRGRTPPAHVHAGGRPKGSGKASLALSETDVVSMSRDVAAEIMSVGVKDAAQLSF